MQSQGLTPSVVEDTIANGQSTVGKVKGTTAHFDPENNVTAITTTQSGRVRTVARGRIKE
jgi:hypothetical protein